MLRSLGFVTGFVLSSVILSLPVAASPQVELMGPPSLSPDGTQVAFAWNGDVWSAPVEGGRIRQLTYHPARDSGPVYSRDGKQMAFVSDRTGSNQIYVMPSEGGAPRQVTSHSEGYMVHDWWPDGKSLLVTSMRDHHWRDSRRMYRVWLDGRGGEELIVDAAAADPKLSPDGTRILLVREGERWWRKGYYGSRAAQIWMYDLEKRHFTQLIRENYDCRWPVWTSDGRGFYYTRGELAGYDLWRAEWSGDEQTKLTQERVLDVDTFSVVFPSGGLQSESVVYRHGKDLYRWSRDGDIPRVIRLEVASDVAVPVDGYTRELDEATDVAFSSDGLEIAFIAGGDVWVMDTLFREPRQVTTTATYETSVLWGPDDRSLWVVQQQSTRSDLFVIERAEPQIAWWQTSAFKVRQVTDDAHAESRLSFTPDGRHLVFVRDRGELCVRNLESGQVVEIAKGFDPPQFDISPDSRWIAYSQTDDNFNRDIFIAPLDGSRPPVNVSQHPDDDQWPAFSRDGKILAYTGLQVDGEPDIYYVYLERDEEDKSSRERKLEAALEKFKKAREKENKSDSKGDKNQAGAEKEGETEKEKEEQPKQIEIDFEGIHERVHRIAIGGAHEQSLVWIDDQKLLFQATINGRQGTWSLEFPDKLAPNFFSSATPRDAVWSAKAKALLVNDSGVPARVDAKGAVERYSFRVRQEVSRAARYAHAFDIAWRTMRDRWYDPRLGNRHWDEIRRRYRDMAAGAVDRGQLAEVMELMLGELNGSHLGFRPERDEREWQGPRFAPVTAHLGLRFQQSSVDRPGLVIRDVLPGGPTDRADVSIAPGGRLLAIDGITLTEDTDLTEILNGPLDRDIRLTFATKGDGIEDPPEEREATIRPITYDRARQLLYEAWLRRNRERVDELSAGQLGYLHIRQMNMGSFSEFERQLYAAGNGKQGLVIDVRDNGGGSTADLLLTSLTQPRHATTIPRGGGPGYPQSRMVFATWQKPIVVLCNQNSFSNAEIFSHAIKTLGRGNLVGVPTAGGVISTGETRVLDVGTMRMPFRGWFVLGTGADMELAGAVPDEIVWPEPGELPQGIDRQLDRGVALLQEEVASQPAPASPKYATEREAPPE